MNATTIVPNVDAILETMFASCTVHPSVLWMSLDAAAEIGIDISEAPQGSIVRLSAGGVIFEVHPNV